MKLFKLPVEMTGAIVAALIVVVVAHRCVTEPFNRVELVIEDDQIEWQMVCCHSALQLTIMITNKQQRIDFPVYRVSFPTDIA